MPGRYTRARCRVIKAGALLLGLSVTAVTAADASFGAANAERRGRTFWIELAKDCAVPADETAAGLVSEGTGLLGSPDPFWRDDVGYGVVASCVYQKRLLTDEERRALVERLSGNLRIGIGGHDDDRVLLRSFSALDLSILAALELQHPVLGDAGYRKLLDDALAYLRNERDLRDFDPRVGWIHATAHTSDLLKFLARDPRFTAADEDALLNAAWDKMTTIGTPVFTHAEDERLAAALVSIARRQDFRPETLESWLVRFVDLEKKVWQTSPPDAATLDIAQNSRNLLRSFHLLLALRQPEPTPGQITARDKALATLQQIRR
jgi:hypothetical protein